MMSSIIVCRPRTLPIEKLETAARRAVEVNPDNALDRRSALRRSPGASKGPRRIAVLVSRKWPSTGVDLSVSFLDSPSKTLRARILEHLNAWSTSANVRFRETSGLGEVRIARVDSPPSVAGYWSYLGTEILDADENEPTMNLEGFTMNVSDAEFRRVVRHEAGHTLGFEHEHMRSDLVAQIDRQKAIAYFQKTDGWSPQEVEEQVLTPLASRSIMGTAESDPLSIMCYQLPANIMKKGRAAIAGGKDINPKDAAFAAKLYPKKASSTASHASDKDSAAAIPSTPLPTRDTADSDAFHLIVLDDSPMQGGGEQRDTPEFARVLATYGGARVMSMMRLRAPKGGRANRRRITGNVTSFGRIIGIHERIRAYTGRDQGTLPTDGELITLGVDLFDTLFQGDVRRLYDEARVRERRRLDFVLTSMIPWIAEKPWEFAFDPGRRTFLATEDIHFVRNVLTNIPADPIQRANGPLRILVAAAQPVGFGRLSIEQEIAVIRRGFEPLVEAGLASIEVLARTTPKEIHGYLSTGSYQVVHFIGHGVYDEASQQGCLIFQTEQGGEYTVGEREVREIFCGRGLSLIFLNACESGRGGRADFNKGIAQSFVQNGVPAVVANQYTVLDSSATAFAQHFYWCLGQGMSLGFSAREARIAVNYSLHGEPIDWAIPVLYARDPHSTLCEVPVRINRVPRTTVRPTMRRAIAGRTTRVAVWDIDDVFPALDKTLETMNAVQSVFGFEVADLSLPLDAWDHDSSDKVSYLKAERLADRLRSRPAELRVDLLACITRHWMEGSSYKNIYGWWPSNKKPPIVIFSAAGFDRLRPEGRETDRVIANALVDGLAGFYGNIDSHKRRNRCPLWFNPNREYEHVAGHQAFDAQCRRKLKTLGDKLPALEKLLDTFPDEDETAT